MARPRSFDTVDALAAATRVFLVLGFEGATLDDLTEAMGINKPSLYAAFGDKGSLYAKVLEQYGDAVASGMRATLDQGESIDAAGRALLLGAIDVYAPKGHQGFGCLIATTATTVAGSHPAVREQLRTFLANVDRLISDRLRLRFGDVFPDQTILAVTCILSATMYSLAIRARAGTPRKELMAIADNAVQAIKGLARK